MPKYQIKPSYSGPRRVSDTIMAAEVARIEATGPLTAKRVVDESRPETAPLHPEFTWDNWIAAELWRQGEARKIITAIEVVEEPEGPGKPKEIRQQYIHVPAQNPRQEGSYVPVDILVTQPDQFRRALEEMLRGLEAMEKKVHFMRRLAEDMPESVTAQIALAHEGFHLIREALEGLKAA